MLMHIYIKKIRLSDLILKIGKNKKLKELDILRHIQKI